MERANPFAWVVVKASIYSSRGRSNPRNVNALLIAAADPMNREKFSAFVSKAIEDVVQYAEEKAGQKLPRTVAFQWFDRSDPRITENIVEHIVKRMFIEEEHIYTCRLGVVDLLEDGSLLIAGSVEDYAPRPFAKKPGRA
jgi:hypothetical protein